MIIVFGQVVAVAEARGEALKWLQLFDFASLISLMLAIFGIHTLARLTSNQLSQFGFFAIFRIVDVALMLFSAQHPILFQNIFLRFGVIHCGSLLSPQDNARFICNFAIICELFLLSILSTLLVSPHRNCLFDLYTMRRRNKTVSTTVSSTNDNDPICPESSLSLCDREEYSHSQPMSNNV